MSSLAKLILNSQYKYQSPCLAMERICIYEVRFSELSHSAPFIMIVGNEEYLDADEWLLCLHFSIEVNPLLLVEREKYDEDMVLMRTIF